MSSGVDRGLRVFSLMSVWVVASLHDLWRDPFSLVSVIALQERTEKQLEQGGLTRTTEDTE